MQLSTGYVIGDEGDIAHFEGIPFAAPPVGNLRLVLLRILFHCAEHERAFLVRILAARLPLYKDLDADSAPLHTLISDAAPHTPSMRTQRQQNNQFVSVTVYGIFICLCVRLCVVGWVRGWMDGRLALLVLTVLTTALRCGCMSSHLKLNELCTHQVNNTTNKHTKSKTQHTAGAGTICPNLVLRTF